MRVWMAGLLALGIVIGGATGSPAAPRKAASSKSKSLAYLCPNCNIGAASSKPCPSCKLPMGRLGMYACMTCHVSSYTPGPCPNCRESMKYLPSQFQLCRNCSFYHLKSKKACPTCTKRSKAARR